MSEYLLETTAAIAVLNGDSQVEHLLSQIDDAYVPSVVLGELYFGAEKSARREQNIKRVDEFATQRIILVCDSETARWYGRIAYQLQAKGRPIQMNDIWIAAIAMQHNLILLTRDTDFNAVENLQVQGW